MIENANLVSLNLGKRFTIVYSEQTKRFRKDVVKET